MNNATDKLYVNQKTFLELTVEAEGLKKLHNQYQNVKKEFQKKKNHCKTFNEEKKIEEILFVINQKILELKESSEIIGQEINRRMQSYYPSYEPYAKELIFHYVHNLSYREIETKPSTACDNKLLNQGIKRLVLATQITELLKFKNRRNSSKNKC